MHVDMRSRPHYTPPASDYLQYDICNQMWEVEMAGE